LEQGKAACHAKQIPENILYEAATDVLGLSEFDESIFKKKITEILVLSSISWSLCFVMDI
jgi:site-specific DNA recombinase